MSVPIQSSARLVLSDRAVHGTAWSIAGTRITLTTRAEIAPGSHVRIELELGIDAQQEPILVSGDAMVWDATRTGETRPGLSRYAVELRAMSHVDQERLGRWLEARSAAADASLDEPTDLLLGGSQSLSTPMHERATELTPVEPAPRRARASVRQVRSTRATVTYSAGSSRLQLAWTSLEDLHTDWLCSLSHGVLYLPNAPLQVGEAVVIVAVLPDGRRALLSGRTSSTARGLAVIELSIGHAARALLTTPAFLPAIHDSVA